ncbi:HpcH/HpaI aldolase/citrate lyase family protein [Arthrobacter sp. H14-L1]|uniref:HpcH/HpaI aldolase/citrate lyase family protein n=1 Tax=Arthrobacter sp. H14-L1 TaxID=2996697 RepID=UPI002271F22A|nr:HpcH/HpaI aldolase/citrate lyase family protein [Arthrobacter sp. H14-L1]MCY0906614.1 HpcH/HpaI aldolase/citrate lyase family protein [Arthrobacter sp. H14-L1]
MRHFDFLTEQQTSRLFHASPQALTLESDPELLAVALGATLYSPADRPQLAADIIKQSARGCLSMVLCLEDSIADSAVEAAEDNVVRTLQLLAQEADGPRADGSAAPSRSTTFRAADSGLMLFIRVRTPEQMVRLAQRCGASLDLLTGFVIPKFENETGRAQLFLDALQTVQAIHAAVQPDASGMTQEQAQHQSHGSRRLRIMPILESPIMIHRETRSASLANIRAVLQAHRQDILAVRIGATDMSSTFGLRRSRDLTIYDVKVVASVIGDIVNILGRSEDGFVISGPVWEHYANTERLLRPLLRATPFADSDDVALRQRILLANLDGLMREISLDHANGLLGKTVIHPSHVPLVHALSVISHEEFLDAGEIAGNSGGGAAASPYGNKMNEMKPHQGWARQTLLRAAAFGVAAPDVTFVDFLEAGMN